MTSHRLLAHLGTSCLIIVAGVIGACAGASPDADGESGGTSGFGGGSGSDTSGVSGMTSTGGVGGTGGQATAGGAVSSGGQSGAGGVVSSGGSGGTDEGSAGTGGSASGSGGSGGSGSGSGSGGYPLKNPPVPSAGCGKATTITSSGGYKTIMSSGDQRQYVITLPANYDMNKPHRFLYTSHGQGGEGAKTQREGYYGFVDIPDAVSSSILVAASGIGGIWGAKDVPLFDDILAFVKQNACVDESRVFVLGFSFGGMYSYSLSMTRQKTIRAGIGMSPANYNITIPTKSHEPIAWMQSTGMRCNRPG
jgi:hypothetical protein